MPCGVRLTANGGDAGDLLALPPAVLHEFLDDVAAGRAHVPIHRTYRLDEIANAHANMEAGRATANSSSYRERRSRMRPAAFLNPAPLSLRRIRPGRCPRGAGACRSEHVSPNDVVRIRGKGTCFLRIDPRAQSSLLRISRLGVVASSDQLAEYVALRGKRLEDLGSGDYETPVGVRCLDEGPKP